MDHDFYMFTPLEHQMLRQLTPKVAKKKAWRVYGEKTNDSTGITRRYYRCMMCEHARYCLVYSYATFAETKCIQAHAPSCQNLRHP